MKIIAIGGGGNGRPNMPYDMQELDAEIVAYSGKQNPKLLVVTLAQGVLEKEEIYFAATKQNFSNLGCECEMFSTSDIVRLPHDKIRQKFLSSDIIYVAGGNTLGLMNYCRKYGLTEIFAEAAEKDIVLCGSSAGGICWFRYGNSDSRRYTSGSSQLVRVSGLGFIDALFCPHFDTEIHRKTSVKKMLKNTPFIALAFENCSAIKTDGKKYEILKTKPSVKAFKCYWQKGDYITKEINGSGDLDSLLRK